MRLDGVGKRYHVGGPWVLRDISLDLEAGRVVRIGGANGNGKSTLLRVVAGVSPPSHGRVTGRPATGYIPERFPPALPMRTRDYLRHHERMRRAPSGSGVGWLERLGAAAFAGTEMRELSKGTSQKVAVAQALLGDPGLLVLDEAWTGLDVAARAVLEDAVRERAADGACVVFVDHDQTRLADGVDEFWDVGRGQLTRSDAVPASRTVIEAGGLPDAMPADLAPNVRYERTDGADRVRIVVDTEHAEDALRALLALGAGVRILTLRRGR